jgi:hypothetical protein
VGLVVVDVAGDLPVQGVVPVDRALAGEDEGSVGLGAADEVDVVPVDDEELLLLAALY